MSINQSIHLFGVLCRFQHCTGHITTGSWKGRGNQYIQLVNVLYCKLLTNGKQLPAFPLEVRPGSEPRSQRWEASVTTQPPWPPSINVGGLYECQIEASDTGLENLGNYHCSLPRRLHTNHTVQ